MGSSNGLNLHLLSAADWAGLRDIGSQNIYFRAPDEEDQPTGEALGGGGGESGVGRLPQMIERVSLNLPATFRDPPNRGLTACKVLGGIGMGAGTGLVGAGLGVYFSDENRTSRFFDQSNTVPLVLVGVGAALDIAGGLAVGICLNKR